MQRLLWLIFLVTAIGAFAQEPSVPPPHDNQSIPRDEQQMPGSEKPVPRAEPQYPPDTKAPESKLSTEQVSAAIDDRLAGEPALSGTSVKAIVTDDSVVLTGAVDNDSQHELTLRIVGLYAGERKVVDNLAMRPKM